MAEGQGEGQNNQGQSEKPEPTYKELFEAAKAFMMTHPISGLAVTKGANRHPAMAPIIALIAHVIEKTVLMRIPIKEAAFLFWAVALMAFPILVNLKKR